MSSTNISFEQHYTHDRVGCDRAKFLAFPAYAWTSAFHTISSYYIEKLQQLLINTDLRKRS